MRAEGGITLVEVLVGMMLGLVTLAAMVALISSSLAAWKRAGAGAETVTAAAGALDQLVRDLRVSGYDPRQSALAGIVVAEAAAVELTADLDGSGAVDLDSEEHVTYRPSSAGDTLQRIVGRQSLPILSDLAPGGFRLRYYDGDGAEVDPTLPAGRAAIRLVTCVLTTRKTGDLPGIRVAGGARLLNR